MSLQGAEKKKAPERRCGKKDLRLAEVDEDEVDHDRTWAAGIDTCLVAVGAFDPLRILKDRRCEPHSPEAVGFREKRRRQGQNRETQQ